MYIILLASNYKYLFIKKHNYYFFVKIRKKVLLIKRIKDEVLLIP